MTADATTPRPVTEPARASRRHLLRLAGAAAAGGGAALLASNPASAAGPYVGDGGGASHGVEGFNPGNGQAGVFGHAATFNSFGVMASNDANDPDAVALKADSKFGIGIYVGSAVVGADIRGADTGLAARGGYIGIEGVSTGANSVGIYGHTNGGLQSVGVQGIGRTGVDGRGDTFAGVAAVGQMQGVHAITNDDNGVALRLEPNRFFDLGPKVAAPLKEGAYDIGDLDMDGTGTLWQCVVAGVPGTWRVLAGPATAGAYHAVNPGRVYDSREALPAPGALASGSNRTISVASRRNTAGGGVVVANFIPAGATAVTANITIVTVAGAGVLAVNPGGVTTTDASTINWTAAGQVIANGVTLTLNNNRELTIVCFGGGTTHVIVDITGYYR